MSDLKSPGLQIEPRCIKCGTAPTIQVMLLEMQNHLYICDSCRQEEEQKGKHIAWASSIQTQAGAVTSPRMQPGIHEISAATLFSVLEVAPDAVHSEVKSAIEEKMRFWMYQPDSEEKTQNIERLRRWQEDMLSDPQWLDAQRSALHLQKKPEGSALKVGEKLTYTAQEFMDACEASRQGWYDGEQLLRKGELQQWILFQLENRMLASEVGRLAQADIPDFRALNHILYRLVPGRPFRLYRHENWEPVSLVPCASTPMELAQLCDTHWVQGEQHLYKGSMLSWLEYAQSCQGLSKYYKSAIKGYGHDRSNWGLGLELVLERAVPQLPHPQLVVTFDGIEGQYAIPEWDREISHKPILVQVENLTRGYADVTLEVIKTGPADTQYPQWLSLEHIHALPAPTPQNKSVSVPSSSIAPVAQPIIIRGRPGAGMPAQKVIRLINLATLKRGKSYHLGIRMIERHEFRKEPVVHEYPITIQTMTAIEGFRGKLWRKGLRGGLPGLAWNFAAGTALASCALLLVPLLLAPAYANWQGLLHTTFTFNTALAISAAGSVDLLRTLNILFAMAIGIITGITGLLAGRGKGHSSYTTKNGNRIFIKTAMWSAIAGFFILLAWYHGSSTVDTHSPIYALWHSGGSLFVGLLIFLLIFLVAMIRTQLENSLRTRHATLLNPPGKG